MAKKSGSDKIRKRTIVDPNFLALSGFMAKTAKGSLARNTMFSLCVRSSAAKCFEFNQAVPSFAKGKNSFFAMSSLRGICEDLIVLRFVQRMSASDRKQLIAALAGAEIAMRTKLQGEFFATVRPQQPVLQLKNPDLRIKEYEAAARVVWQKHGWPNLSRGSMPPIRQIAEKQGLQQLIVLYDYLYRLTSGAVHFNVQSLLRSGWGPNMNQVVFSSKNFHSYFSNYCALYGAFLFCLYFEFFPRVLRPPMEEREMIKKIREGVLMTPRWPEMVTFEEMNQQVPSGPSTVSFIVTALQAAMRKRLISKSTNYRNAQSAERKNIAKLVKLLAPDKSAFVKLAKPAG